MSSATTRLLAASLATTLAAAVLAALPAAHAVEAEPTADRAARAAEVAPIRVGTYNIQAATALSRFKPAVESFKAITDVAGLQEIGSNERHRFLDSDQRWGVYHGPTVQQDPVLWRREMFRFVSGRDFRIAGPANLGNELGPKNTRKGPSVATVVRLVHRTSGQRLSFINVHLLHGAVRGARPNPKRPRAFSLYREQVAGTVQAIRAEKAASDRVFLLGDLNADYKADVKWRHKRMPYRSYTPAGLTSMWQGSPYLTTSYGTRNGSLIDQVWSNGRPSSTFISRSITASDHRAAVATYDLPVETGYQPPQGRIGFSSTAVSQRECDRDFQTRRPIKVRLTGDLRDGYAFVDVVNGSAREGVDFTIDPTSLYDSDPVNYVDVYIIPNLEAEPDKTFTLRLTEAAGTALEPGREQATFTILNDDPKLAPNCPPQ